MLRSISKMLPERFPAFFLVGGLGFAVDASVLIVLVHSFNWDVYTGRLASAAASVTTTWLLNSNFVFAGGKATDRRQEYRRYLALQVATAAINYTLYVICIISSTFMHSWPAIAAAIGSAAGLVFNYAGSRSYVFGARADL